MLKLTLSGGHAEDYVWRTAELLQQVPGVLRVRVECSQDQIEIIFRCPAEGLLQSIHKALREAGNEIVAGKTA
jgi:hypothetical protein